MERNLEHVLDNEIVLDVSRNWHMPVSIKSLKNNMKLIVIYSLGD